jgi:NADH-quinone oxidoreductase subunit K/NAD(P)H-quinone oxidoreductase subunit 4L
VTAVPLSAFLVVSAILFAIGLYAILAQRTAVMVLMGIETILNAVGLNIVAFWRYVQPGDYSAQIFTIVIITIGAVEMAVGLGIMMLLYRRRQTVQVDKYEELRG